MIKSEKCVNRVSLYADNWEVDAAMESSQEEDAGRLVDSFSLEKLRSHHDIQIQHPEKIFKNFQYSLSFSAQRGKM